MQKSAALRYIFCLKFPGDIDKHEEQCQIPDCPNFALCQAKAVGKEKTCSP